MAGPLSYALTLNTRAFRGGMNVAQGTLSRFKGAASVTTSVLTKMVAPLAILTSGAALAATTFKTLSVASNMEQTAVGLKSLIGNMKETKQLLSEVKALSSATPFEFPELARSTRSLVAMDVEVGKIPDTLKRIGDVASGVQAPIEELSLLYGRAKNDGVLYTETLNQMNDRGIPVFTELGKIMGVSNTQVKKLASEGKITFPLLEQSFINLTKEGGKFNGMMAAQSETNAGLLSTLKDGFTDLMLIIGTPINDALKPVLKQAIGLVKRVGLGLSGIVDIAKSAISQGRLGELLSQSIMIGLKEAANVGVSTFVFLGEMLFKAGEFALKQLFELFTGGYNEAIGNVTAGSLKVLRGLGSLILSTLSSPFLDVAALFSASLEKGINEVLATITSIPIVADFFGFKTESQTFDEIHAAAKKRFGKQALRNSGEKDINEGLTQMGTGISQKFKKDFDIAKEVFKGTEFEKINIFDLDEDKAALGELSKELNPEGYQKVIDALNPPADSLKDAADKTKDAITEADGLKEAIAKVNEDTSKPKPVKQASAFDFAQSTEKPEKMRGLVRGADALKARFERQAAGTVGSFKNFVTRSKLDTEALRRSGGLKTNAAQLGRSVNAAERRQLGSKPAVETRRTAEEMLLAVVKKIDGKFENLASA